MVCCINGTVVGCFDFGLCKAILDAGILYAQKLVHAVAFPADDLAYRRMSESRSRHIGIESEFDFFPASQKPDTGWDLENIAAAEEYLFSLNLSLVAKEKGQSLTPPCPLPLPAPRNNPTFSDLLPQVPNCGLDVTGRSCGMIRVGQCTQYVALWSFAQNDRLAGCTSKCASMFD